MYAAVRVFLKDEFDRSFFDSWSDRPDPDLLTDQSVSRFRQRSDLSDFRVDQRHRTRHSVVFVESDLFLTCPFELTFRLIERRKSENRKDRVAESFVYLIDVRDVCLRETVRVEKIVLVLKRRREHVREFENGSMELLDFQFSVSSSHNRRVVETERESSFS